jgi:pyridoxamine 5'-phosphate oxidase
MDVERLIPGPIRDTIVSCMQGNLHDLRQNYTRGGLLESEAAANPIEQFDRWFNDAVACGVPEPNAMSLASVGADGKPRIRTLLLKDYNIGGFSFYTNLESKKGKDLQGNPNTSVLFFWIQMERQIRIDGTVSLLPREEVDNYFRVRPRESQIGAWASNQSQPIESREVLEQRMEYLTNQYKDKEIPTPPHWGGYRITPYRMEFWQGRPGRLHDRLEYTLNANQEWTLIRLQP